MKYACVSVTCFLGVLLGLSTTESPIRFTGRELPFTLANGETERKYLPGTTPGGIALLDFDGDGHLDIFFANGASLPALNKSSAKFWDRLYRNRGDGTFIDVTERAGLAGRGYNIGAAAADYDNDGDQDLFVAGVRGNTLYRNQGDGTFIDNTRAARLETPEPRWAVGAAWLDFDNDGLLDLFIVNYVRWKPEEERVCLNADKPDYCHPRYYQPVANSLYRNKGDGSFIDVSETAGIAAHPGKGMAVAVSDVDNDGFTDLFVTNDRVFNFLFRNLGNGRFSEIGFEAGVAVPEHGNPVSGMGADFRDFNNDGYTDLFFTALAEDTFPLFRNTGKAVFEEVTEASGLARITRQMAGWSAGLRDFDNDGCKDIFVARSDALSPLGGRGEKAKQTNSVFRNLGDKKFHDVTAPSGLAGRSPQMYRGAAFGDLNGDGRIDVVVSALNAPAEVWMNTGGGGNHWLALRLEGTVSNRNAVCARVRLETSNGAQYDYVTTAAGYASSSTGPLHFGLGASTVAKRIDVRWPSGRVQHLENVKAGQVLHIQEAR